MSDRSRSLVPQQRRDVAPARSPARGVVQHQARVPDIVRERQAPQSRNAVIPAPDLNWRTVDRDERRHTEMVPASRRDVEVRPRPVERHQEPVPYVEEYDYPVEYDYDRPVRVRHQVRDDGRSVNVNVHVENRNETGPSSDLEGLWVGGGFVVAAFIIGLFLAIAVHH